MLAWFGVTTTATKVGAACACTVILAAAESVPLLAVIVAVPSPRPMANPEPFTEAVAEGTANQLTEFVKLLVLPSVTYVYG